MENIKKKIQVGQYNSMMIKCTMKHCIIFSNLINLCLTMTPLIDLSLI